MKDKFLQDMARDPLWYGSILGHRLHRLLNEVTPPSIALGNGVSFPIVPFLPCGVWGYGTVLLAVWLLTRRDWFRLKLLAFTLPLTVTALFVYSGAGTVFYSITHLVAVAIVVTAGWERFVAWRTGEALVSPETVAPLRLGAGAGRWVVGLGLSGLLALIGLREVARRATDPSAALRQGGSPLVAVLPFENQTSDASLAWIGDALGDLVATRLQSAGVRILDPEAVRWLDPDTLRWSRDGALIPPRPLAVNIVADRSAAQRVVAGRVRREGRELFACVEVLAPPQSVPMKADSCGRLDLKRPFEASEQLVRAVQPVLGGRTPDAQPAPPASADALRLYTEARRAIRVQEWGEAARTLDGSVAADPLFLPARVLRARLWSRWRQAAAAVPGDGSTSGGALTSLEDLRAAVSRQPDSIEARVDLGRALVDLEMFDEAVTVLDPILSTPGVPAEAFGLLAGALAAGGDMGRGYQALLEYQRRAWEEPTGVGQMSDHLMAWGALGQASEALDLATAFRSNRGMPSATVEDLNRRWRIHALQDEWVKAEKAAVDMLHLDDPRAAGTATLQLARGYLFGGRSRVAGALAEEAAFRFAQGHVAAADALSAAIEVRLGHDDTEGALGLVRQARAAGPLPPDPRVEFWEPIALAHAGRWAEAARARDHLAESVREIPGPTGTRLVRRLDGELSLLRGDPRSAVSSLAEAARLLPARGACGDHVPIWFSLARAYLAAGQPAQAEAWSQKAASASLERLCSPIPYARSFALLGRLQAAAGHGNKAAEAYGRFLDLWGDGDLATAEREEARQFLARSRVEAPHHTGAPLGRQAGEAVSDAPAEP